MNAIKVRHSDLKRFCPESIYKSECPNCKRGLLLMRRDQNTGKLLEYDNCIQCGQIFIYTDIEELRQKELKLSV